MMHNGLPWAYSQWGLFSFDNGKTEATTNLPVQANVYSVVGIDWRWDMNAHSMSDPTTFSIEGFSMQTGTRLTALTHDPWAGDVRYIAIASGEKVCVKLQCNTHLLDFLWNFIEFFLC